MSDISRFPVAEVDELPPDLRERIDAVAEKTGFVPNVFLALAHRPDEFRAFFAYYEAVMEREGALSKAERELIVVATSSANSCPYCVVAHGALLRIRSKDPLLADQVAVNYRSAPLDRRQRALLDLAMKLAVAPGEFGDEDLAAARRDGLTDDEIWEAGAVTSLFALSNRMAHLADIRPNPEFYGLGR